MSGNSKRNQVPFAGAACRHADPTLNVLICWIHLVDFERAKAAPLQDARLVQNFPARSFPPICCNPFAWVQALNMAGFRICF
jgi:hypothetical protein